MADVRPIDANALESEISSLVMVITGLRCGKGVLRDFAVEYKKSIQRIVNDAPTLDYAPVRHGRWMIHHYNSEKYEYEDIPYNPLSFDNPSGMLFCSVCDAEALLNAHEEDVPSKCCPNCGAKMYGGKANEG